MSNDHKTIARRYMENVMGNGDLRVAHELCTPSFQHHFPGMPGPVGRDATTELSRGFQIAFPDLRVAFEDQLVDGDRVVTRMTFHGTHDGPFQGIAPTRRKVRFTGINIARIEGGHIAALWSEFDAAGLMQQLGTNPAA